MRDVFNKLIRRMLALTIRCPKKPKTKGDILKYALRWYLNSGSSGLCRAIDDVIGYYRYKYNILLYDGFCISQIFPLFNKRIAICLFNGSDDMYWWPIEDWKNRYRYMRWLIKEYDKEKL